MRVETLEAQRGEIFASDGSLLAQGTHTHDTIYMNTTKVEDIGKRFGRCLRIDRPDPYGNHQHMFNAAVEDGTDIVVLAARFFRTR